MAIDLDSILKQIEASAPSKKSPPVHLWHPAIVGEIDLVIDQQQQWFHEGTAFTRPSLVNLLASVMRKDGEEYFLVTPTEKMKIHVADVPFSIVSMIIQEKGASELLTLVTNTDDIIVLDRHCQWQLRSYSSHGQTLQLPYIEVRNDLWARVSRHVYYQMVALATYDEVTGLCTLNSAEQSFSLGCIT